MSPVSANCSNSTKSSLISVSSSEGISIKAGKQTIETVKASESLLSALEMSEKELSDFTKKAKL